MAALAHEGLALVDDVLRMPFDKGLQVVRSYAYESLACLATGPSDVWGQVTAWSRQQGACGLWRLLAKHVGTVGCQPAFL